MPQDESPMPGFPTFNEDSSAHGTLVSFGDPGARVTLGGLDGGSGGLGQLELRYWPASAGTFRLRVNGAQIEDRAFAAERGQYEWRRMRFSDVPLTAGATNTVEIELLARSSWQGIGLDDLTVATPEELALASSHRVALTLSGTERSQLVAFLSSLDRTDAGAPPSQNLVFTDGFETGNTQAWSQALP